MLRAANARKKYLVILSSILILCILGWYKWPSTIPNYEKGQTDVNLLYFDGTDKGTTASLRVPQNDVQARELLSLVKNIQFYKKIIQPSGVKSYSRDTGEIQVFIYTTRNGQKEVFVLSVIDDGTIRIRTGASQRLQEYGIGYPGKQQERTLYEQLYQFYRDTLTNPEWKSGEK